MATKQIKTLRRTNPVNKKRDVSRKMNDLVGRGRRISVRGTEWAYRVGRGGNVIAYSEKGERRLSTAWDIKGHGNPEIFDRGQWKKTSDGMLTPCEIEKWLSTPNDNHEAEEPKEKR